MLRIEYCFPVRSSRMLPFRRHDECALLGLSSFSGKQEYGKANIPLHTQAKRQMQDIVLNCCRVGGRALVHKRILQGEIAYPVNSKVPNLIEQFPVLPG